MAGAIDKGQISRILPDKDWNGHPCKATVNPCTNAGAITPVLTIPWHLRGKIGCLKVGDVVVYSLFDDGTGIILDRLDGEWKGIIDYPTTTTGDVINEKTETTIGKFTGTGGMAISGGTGATVDGQVETTGDVVAGAISVQSHTHTAPHGQTSAPNGSGSGGEGGGGTGGTVTGGALPEITPETEGKYLQVINGEAAWNGLPVYGGSYEATPATTQQVLNTAQKYLESDVVIKEIPYSETSNTAGGTTVFIGKELE